tara:strand:+ start:1713 stop:2144 length:432 start_codon:yes stop_codon:yes gene_type:complete
MQKQFTEDNLTRLKELFTALSFKGEAIDGKFGANVLNPYELLNSTSISTLRTLLGQTRKAKNEIEELDEWSMSSHQQSKKVRFEVWFEFINLLIGYRLDQDEKAATKADKAKKAAALKARIATEEDKGKTLDDLKAELATLEA